MARTTSAAVAGVLVNDYDGTTSLTPYIDTANAITNRTRTAAIAKGITLSAAELELVERWLAAHYYTKMDPVYTSKSTGGASASFVRSSEEPYKDVAINLDYSGCLKAILARQFASAVWLGKPVSSQIPLDQRD